ncbi:hypothetical protein ERO13_A09G152950v2 [Gossypium hirsutum]|uniref:Secreted protein n=5 Tax=Gossypium TaxID=3633 RepID=A0ABR0NSC9_GOSAR|nr:hypothetical protein ES319_A09G162800v1 [Gossypium barbadense]KAG4184134.1 hypothetical protein ERO13_A09G152950v2 [Gossypium hirsutum]KAK5804243.1 hypothetical protein PVK06_031892 [Gossypium arboreum]TYH02990.1 hypothetical protein ES288_A09G184500v1 [Gossypium darwinii]TYI10997.1 hypothetical protein ES332_A09G180300v1 [Gossypium tomentosum]TYJ19042.1 hypothetical protein E1A91_A09G164000v1 [Gossypium mustelinum]
MNSSNLCLPCTLPLCRLLYTGEDRVICILRFISTCLFVESSPWGADYLFLTAIQNLLHLKQEFKHCFTQANCHPEAPSSLNGRK